MGFPSTASVRGDGAGDLAGSTDFSRSGGSGAVSRDPAAKAEDSTAAGAAGSALAIFLRVARGLAGSLADSFAAGFAGFLVVTAVAFLGFAAGVLRARFFGFSDTSIWGSVILVNLNGFR